MDVQFEINSDMKLLQIYNLASHYRGPIYRLIDQEIGGDFCFGDKVFGQGDIKKMDYSTLKGKVWEVKNIKLPFGHYNIGVPGLIKADYDTYIVVGETHNLSIWLFLFRSLFYHNKRVFLWSHGMLGDESWINRQVIRLFYSMCKGAFIYNERSCRIMSANGIPTPKLHPIYNSLDYDAQLPIRQSLKPSRIYQEYFGNENKNIVFIGRLTKVKRFDLLIEAIIQLNSRGEQVNVTLIGDGEDKLDLERMVEERGIKEQVWFFGACYDERRNAEMLYNADLCVSPGFIGLTAMHVLMFGCPAITHDDFNHQVPEFEAIQEGETGAFFKKGDSASLAETISYWFKNHNDDRERVRKDCYKEIDTRWNPHNQIRILKQILLEDK